MTYSPDQIHRSVHAVSGASLLGAMLLLLAAAGCDDDMRTIEVQTQPPEARVFIDGQLMGFSPCKVKWKDTRPDDLWELHVIDVKAKGYDAQRKEIRYRSGEAWLPDRIEITLIPSDELVSSDVDDSTPEEEKPQSPKVQTWTPKKESSFSNANPPSQPSAEKKAVAVKQQPVAKKEPAKEPAKENNKAVEPKPVPPAAIVKKDDVKKQPTAETTPPASAPASPAPVEPAPVVQAPAAAPVQPQLAKTDANSDASFSIWRPKGRPSPAAANSVPASNAQPTPQPAAGKTATPAVAAPAIPVVRTIPSTDDFVTSGPNRLLACEIRLVRLSDGRVLSQASLLGPYSQRKEMINVLIKLLAKDAPDDATVAVGCLSNRRREPTGQVVCEEMTRILVRAVQQTPGLHYTKLVNLRDVILDEEMVESPKIVADRRIAHMFTGADHVIVGGAAMAIPVPVPVEE